MNTDYDVTIIGSGFAGSSLAILLKRWRPETRILLVEERPAGHRKAAEVGEATVEVSACFLHRALGLYDHLNEHHLPKHGLRFWFTDGPDRDLAQMGEVGPREIPTLPSFQLDRAVLDEHLAGLAAELGCTSLRPARAVDFDLGWPVSRVRLESKGEEAPQRRWVTTRWVVDAAGRRALLAKRLGHHERVESHPVTAIWDRWRGVADLDGPEVMGPDPREPRIPEIIASRRLATNHFCGYGWWSWMIPLSDGRTSIGLVYNKELFELPGEGSKPERYRRFITRQPGLKELLADAEPVETPISFAHLPYRSRKLMDRGWALVGDAGAFLDPFYSPGLDHASMSIYATALRIEEDLSGSCSEAVLDEGIAAHNAAFTQSYDRWLSALYDGKYELLGDAELTTCAFLVDTALYYLGVVTQVYKDLEQIKNPTFGLPIIHTRIAYRMMRIFNRRMLRLARLRRQAGTYGRRNADWRVFAKSFGLGRGSVGPLFRGLCLWARLELEGIGSRLRTGPAKPPEQPFELVADLVGSVSAGPEDLCEETGQGLPKVLKRRQR